MFYQLSILVALKCFPVLKIHFHNIKLYLIILGKIAERPKSMLLKHLNIDKEGFLLDEV